MLSFVYRSRPTIPRRVLMDMGKNMHMFYHNLRCKWNKFDVEFILLILFLFVSKYLFGLVASLCYRDRLKNENASTMMNLRVVQKKEKVTTLRITSGCLDALEVKLWQRSQHRFLLLLRRPVFGFGSAVVLVLLCRSIPLILRCRCDVAGCDGWRRWWRQRWRWRCWCWWRHHGWVSGVEGHDCTAVDTCTPSVEGGVG